MEEEACRICRGGSTELEPLYYPCRCTGSIRYVHEDCLSEWLSHSGRDHRCELCGAPYKFENIYDHDMPATLPLKVFVYKFYLTGKWLLDKVYLLNRAVILTAVCFTAVKYTFELSTIFGDDLWMTLSYGSAIRTLRRRMATARSPYFSSLDMKFENYWAQELYTAVVDGGGLFFIIFIMGFVIYLATIWALNEQTLLHELEHVANGERMPIEHLRGDFMHGAVGDAPDADQGAALGQEQAVVENDEDDFIDDVDDLFEARVEDEDFFEEGENVWTFVEGLFGGPLLNRLTWFGMLTLATCTVIMFLYQTPYCTGRSLYKILWEMTRNLVSHLEAQYPTLVPSSVKSLVMKNWDDLPEKYAFEYRIAMHWLGCQCIFSAFYLFYQKSYDSMFETARGRTALIVMMQCIAVFKVATVVLVELVLFPLFCGALIHVAILPILTTPLAGQALYQAASRPWLFAFLYWASGLAYMFLLASYLKMCRSFLRPGVLFFVQDPSDPKNEPIRNILAYGWYTHAKKIAMSSVIYAGLIVGCIGGALRLATAAQLVPQIIEPLHIFTTPGPEVFHLWPLACVLYLLKSRAAINWELYQANFKAAWYQAFIRAAEKLDLASFLFGAKRDLGAGGDAGVFVRAPATDTFSARHGLEMFIPVTSDDKRLDGKSSPQPRELKRYTVVWRPRYFRARIGLLFVWLWLVSIRLGLFFALVPLLIGRLANSYIYGNAFSSDVINYAIGAVFLLALRPSIHSLKHKLSLNWKQCLVSFLFIAAEGYLLDTSMADLAQVVPSLVAHIQPSTRPFISWLMYGGFLHVTHMSFPHGGLEMKLLAAYRLYRNAISQHTSLISILVLLAWATQGVKAANKWFKLTAKLRCWLQSARDDYYLTGRRLQNVETSSS